MRESLTVRPAERFTLVGCRVTRGPETKTLLVGVILNKILTRESDHVQHGAERVAEEGESSFTLQLHFFVYISVLTTSHADNRQN